MSKINLELQSKMTSEPNTEISVLITLKEGIGPESIDIKGYNILMENLISAKINSKTIEKLSSKSEVVAIELDSEMGIL